MLLWKLNNVSLYHSEQGQARQLQCEQCSHTAPTVQAASEYGPYLYLSVTANQSGNSVFQTVSMFGIDKLGSFAY